MGKDLFNDRISRFSIRKLNVGVCSVLLGTLVMVGTAASAAAEEKTDTTSESVAAVATASEAPATSSATSAASTAETTSTAATTYEANPAVTAPATSTAPASTSEASSTSTAASAASTAPATSTAATPKLEATTPENNAAPASTSADKKEAPTLSAGQGVTANNTVTTEETANTSRRRNRRAVGDANDPNLIGDDVVDATSTPKEAKPGFTTNVKASDLASQISWLDFGETANWTGTTTTSDGKLALQVGATYTKEIMPGYVVTIKVKSLKPFQATEIYKKRMEERGATEAEKATYDPNARNGYVSGTSDLKSLAELNAGHEAKVIA